MSNQNLEGNVAKSYQTLREGNVAVIRGKNEQGTLGGYRFFVEIGVVNHYSREDELIADMKSRVVDCGFSVTRGKHEGWVGIKPVGDKFIELSAQRSTFGEVTLKLYDYKKDGSLREGKVNSDYFKREGFDLDQENLDNHGAVLSANLSQLLYDFELEQGQFQKKQGSQ